MTVELEKLTRRRRVVLTASGLLFLILQPSVFDTLDAPVQLWRTVDWVKSGAFLLWSSMLILVLISGGFPFRRLSPATRAGLNDELTRANRSRGYMIGYWAMLLCVLVMFAMVQAGMTNANECLRYLFAFGVAIPAVRFARLERRQDA